jgi:hypothetical protein
MKRNEMREYFAREIKGKYKTDDMPVHGIRVYGK